MTKKPKHSEISDILLEDLCNRATPGRQYTQQEIADALGVAQQYVDRIEKSARCKLRKAMLDLKFRAIHGNRS